jgi:hypothetical protein
MRFFRSQESEGLGRAPRVEQCVEGPGWKSPNKIRSIKLQSETENGPSLLDLSKR